ncbi:MAG: xanthine dehydrogenase family protein subunit M, partial [bacterium]
LKDEDVIYLVSVPKNEKRVSHYIKIKEKQAFDWPICEVAICADKEHGVLKHVNLVLGAAAPIPWRATKAEKILEGQAVTPALAEAAGKAAVEDAKPMSQNAYRVPIFEAVVKRAVMGL